ncbi:hypothetical protein MCUN1_003352 [Malassezia cuniculi]|uniref:Transmembrane 9 superfamily member n=1 Tax=Malassezia cuniculi TaxID=948313 RepID=A0AAF0F1D6_9BASI|nr:hypothetical protein MCUN1_003352 [Malassezia cuniculi]
MRTALLLSALVLAPASAWYLPGSSPRSYARGEDVPVQVNVLQPMADTATVRGLVSYDYYDERFAFCRPGKIEAASADLATMLSGDRIYNSAVKLQMLENKTCTPLCMAQVSPKQAEFVNARINGRYAINWLVDQLPVANRDVVGNSTRVTTIGFPLGSTISATGHKLTTPALNNHYEIHMQYHERGPNEFRVVGANVLPVSLAREKGEPSCTASEAMFLSPEQTTEVAYTYSVVWTPSDTPWATRWDAYLNVVDPKIHWYALMNSIAVVALLCVMVAVIMARTVKHDINRYNAIDLTEDIQEDYGWKLVHGEVFRAPPSPMALSILAGSGAHLLSMAAVTLVCALFGFVNPSFRGSLGLVIVLSWVFLSFVSGYISGRTYATFGGKVKGPFMWLNGTVFPGVIACIVLLLNTILIANRSAAAVPFSALLGLGLWYGASLIPCFIGSVFAERSGSVEPPVRANRIPRQIPPTRWYLRAWPSALIAGIMPFGAAWLELFFIMNSLFGNRVYYAFGFLTLTFTVTVITTATVSILFCYFHLCAEDYRWHWRAFLTGGASAFWLFAYGMFFWLTRLSLPSLSSNILFIGYLIVFSLLDFVLFGFVGFAACYVYIRYIYSHIRVD